MQVQSLHIHPVKSTAIRTVGSAALLRSGLAGDRRWMVVDDHGELVSAREADRLFRITARTRDLDGISDDLRLTAEGMPDLAVATPEGEPKPYRIFSGTAHGVPAGTEADLWLGELLQRTDVHLVWCPDPTRRALDPQYSRDTDSTAFADAFPLLLTTQASLDQLNAWIAEDSAGPADPLPMSRFRPNLVVSGAAPFAEDSWQRLQIGEIEFRVAKPSARCVMTTIDPETLAHGREPIRSLARHHRVGSKTIFGQNLIPESAGRLAVGDQVSVKRSDSA